MRSENFPKLLLQLQKEPELLRAPGAWDPDPLFQQLEATESPWDAMRLLDEWRADAPRGLVALIARIDEGWAQKLGKILCCWRMQLAVPGPLTVAIDEALALAWPSLPPAYREVAALWPIVQRAWGLPAPDPLRVDPAWKWKEGVPFPPPQTVEGMQARLNWLGLGCGPVDGRWNTRCTTALRRWQVSAGREPEGEPTEEEGEELALETPDVP